MVSPLHSKTLVLLVLEMEKKTLKVLELKQLRDQMESSDMVWLMFLVLKAVEVLVLKVKPMKEVLKIDGVLADQDLKIGPMNQGLVVVIHNRHHRLGLLVSRHQNK